MQEAKNLDKNQWEMKVRRRFLDRKYFEQLFYIQRCKRSILILSLGKYQSLQLHYTVNMQFHYKIKEKSQIGFFSSISAAIFKAYFFKESLRLTPF